MEELHGYIESIVFSESEKGFTIARLKEPKRSELTTIVGVMPSVQPGETVRCQGIWKIHPEFGRQFEVTTFESRAPADLIGIQKYLESGMIKGIGPGYAGRIVAAFGVKTLDVIDQTPGRLSEVPGLGKKRIENIQNCWQEQKAVRQVMVFLRGHGVSPAFAQKIYKTYGDQSIDKVNANPFALAKEIFGIGFKSADKIAQGLHIAKDAPIRIKAGIEHVLWDMSNDGHVCSPKEELIKVASEILEVPSDLIRKCLEEQIVAKELVEQDELIWLKPLFFAEVGIARELGRLMQATCSLRAVKTDKAMEWVEEQLRIRLAKEQKEAVQLSMEKKVHIITGGPGTGKSTITKAILAISEKLTNRILLAAPTGRAAKRMSEITKKKAFTIHALLEMDFKAGGFKRGRDNPLNCDLLIVDETSMVDTLLMHSLLKAVPAHARLIVIGDVDQLPSVGAGTVLKDMITSEKLPVTRLKQIFRQAAGSRIVVNAHRVNDGMFPDLTAPLGKSDFVYFEGEEPEKVAEIIVDLVKNQLPKMHYHPLQQVQVLSPMKKGIIGMENLNNLLQKALNPHPMTLMRFGRSFHPGDKVMQIRNNYQKEVYNGDVGIILAIDMDEQNLQVSFDGKIVAYEFTEIDELVLAYAVSVHKYQGSECPCVIIPVHTTHFMMLHRNLLYTGITRGKKLVILVGTKKAIAIAIKSEQALKRYTHLEHALKQYL